MLTDLAFETFTRTDAAGTRRGLRASWRRDQDVEVIVRWHYRADPAPWADWLQSEPITAALFEIFPALPGRYELQVFDQSPTRRVYDNGFFEVAVGPLLESDRALPKPSGLELLGVGGALLGSAVTFTGRDLRLRWNAVRLDALETDGAGEAPDDGLLEALELRVLDADRVLLRTVLLPVHASEYAYTYALSTEDQPPTIDPESAVRSVRFELRWKDRTGRLGAPAVLEVEHTLQLSATADIELLATVALTEVVDASDISPVLPIATYVFLDEIELEGLGYPVQVQFTDKIFWETLPVFLDYVFLRYRLRIVDPLGVLVVEVSHEVVEHWGWEQQFGDIFEHPNMTLRALLELGVTYRVQVHMYWDRPIGATQIITADSLHRHWLVTDLKR